MPVDRGFGGALATKGLPVVIYANSATGLVGVLILLLVLLAGVPIGAALTLVGLAGLALCLGLEPALIKGGVTVIETLTRYELGTLPLFILMAQLFFSADASRDLFEAAARMIGHRRGGLAYASVAGCAGFSTINGSSLATAATIGMVALPEMRKRGYSDALATGTIAAGGTLGQMIPPSGALIVFGIISEQSIGKLFTAAIVPGITQMLLYIAVIFLLVRWRPGIAPRSERASWAARWEALRRIGDMALLVAVVIGGITFGWMSPSEAAAIGAVGALAISAWRRRLNKTVLFHAFEETLRTSGMILSVIIGALIFSVFVSVTGLADALSAAVVGAGLGKIATLMLIAVILLVLGCVLDGLGLMLLTTPILLPIVTGLGMSPIWFGIFLIRAMEIGFVHPPLGLNLYVIQGVAKDVPISRIFKGVTPFLISDLLHLLALILLPALVMGLPKALGQ
jgi:tripartite ATP-independent transporter DctM subunit